MWQFCDFLLISTLCGHESGLWKEILKSSWRVAEPYISGGVEGILGFCAFLRQSVNIFSNHQFDPLPIPQNLIFCCGKSRNLVKTQKTLVPVYCHVIPVVSTQNMNNSSINSSSSSSKLTSIKLILHIAFSSSSKCSTIRDFWKN